MEPKNRLIRHKMNRKQYIQFPLDPIEFNSRQKEANKMQTPRIISTIRQGIVELELHNVRIRYDKRKKQTHKEWKNMKP